MKPSYTSHKFDRNRIFTIDTCELGKRMHHVKAFLEFDVSNANEIILQKRREGVAVSLTAWLTKCLANAMQQTPQIRHRNLGKRKVIEFSDVDLTVIVERKINGNSIPLPYIVRRADAKSVLEIQNEIRMAKKKLLGENEKVINETCKLSYTLYTHLPGFIRRFFMNRYISNPFAMKQKMGTAIVTSLGNYLSIPGFIEPISIHPLTMAIGSVIKKPVIREGEVVLRDIAHITIMADHDVVDGMQLAGFIKELKESVEQARFI